jgi:hypothetical protein
MSGPVIILGLNRCGTKLASYRIARSLGLSTIHLEPFCWENRFEVLDDDDWNAKPKSRQVSQQGILEHARLPIWCDGSEESPWLASILNGGAELVKLVELGRAALARRLCPEAILVGLVREPVPWLRSLAGAEVQLGYVAAQWNRLRGELNLPDPLPEAERWLSAPLANCARVYMSLYGGLLPNQISLLDVVLSHEEMEAGSLLSPPLRGAGERGPSDLPQIGLSSSRELGHEAEEFIETELRPAYRHFLDMQTRCSASGGSMAGSARSVRCSFVVVRFSTEYDHNFHQSDCAHDPENEVVLIENRGNLRFPRLGEALNEGIEQAQHEIIVAVHEDVWLYENWQGDLTTALEKLARIDPNWAVLGCVGINEQGTCVGHWRDPHGGGNTFIEGHRVAEISSLDEQLLILRRSSGLRFDPEIPGIHGLGTDLLLSAKKQGLRSYVINAPSWHKRHDGQGCPIQGPEESDKIRHRETLTYLADKRCCDDYIRYKWHQQAPFRSTSTTYGPFRHPAQELMDVPGEIRAQLNRPVVLLAKGGGGSRLLGLMAQDCGVALGSELNSSSDSMEMVMAIYQTILQRYKCPAAWQNNLSVFQLRLAAAKLLMQLEPSQRACWGFKLPESLLALPEISTAFPLARYVVMTRDPLVTSLRRTHMTARLDNEIGRLSLPAAYDWLSWERERIDHDPPVLHMAATVAHQWHLCQEFMEGRKDAVTFLRIRFEDVVAEPEHSLKRFSGWIGREICAGLTVETVDAKRAASVNASFAPDDLERVRRVLESCGRNLGYGIGDRSSSW